MVAQAARMGDVVADLLHLANLEAGEDADREASVPVPKLLLSIREDAVALSRDAPHEITLDCAPDLWLLGVESELRSAFSNLVFNAVRYTPPPGQIDIRWRRDGQGARFSVQDDGEGIAAEHLPRITERFYRVDVARSRDAGGTGLGLAIVKHVLRQHGAELEIESEPGVGSTFTCHFPADRILPPRARRALA
jgi:two-component system phosphate regulon sensor histidine kinase PhoR